MLVSTMWLLEFTTWSCSMQLAKRMVMLTTHLYNTCVGITLHSF